MEETPKLAKLVCRKCGGPHITIKCGKEVNTTVSTTVAPDIIEPVETKKKYTEYVPDESKHRERRQHFKTTYRVKLSGLPDDMEEEELMHMTCDWGHIVRIKLLNYEENSVAYIDFGYMEEAEYFVEAVDKTPFEYLILSAQIVSSEDQHNKKQMRE